MATAIKAIPTLHGDDAIRFREKMERVDKAYESKPSRDLTQDPRYKMMKRILQKSKIS